MERFDVTSRLLLRVGPGGPEQTIALATRQPPGGLPHHSSIEDKTWRILFFFQARARSVVPLSDQNNTDMRSTKTDEIGSDEMFLCLCFFACEMDGSFGMQEGAWFG